MAPSLLFRVLAAVIIGCMSFPASTEGETSSDQISGYHEAIRELAMVDAIQDASFQCKDSEREKDLCPEWKLLNACRDHIDTMRQFCAKTCDLCRQPSPPQSACTFAPYGCCWDNKTDAVGQGQVGCPPCLDYSSTLCTEFAEDCPSSLDKGRFMRRQCPITCGVPCDTNAKSIGCEDHPGHLSDCRYWKNQGLCQTNTAAMKLFCPKTCNLCDKRPN